MASPGNAPAIPARHDARFPPPPPPILESDEDTESSSILAPTRYEPDNVVMTPKATNVPSIPLNAPLHPIPSMQEAFAESLVEATTGGLALKPPLRTADAKTRREKLLDEDKSAGPPAALWRLRPGQRCHELRKLVAQISFGVYLVLNGMANNNDQVVSILQGHIDEVDEFLETTMEDFKLAMKDLTERIEFLKLPMENMEVFEKMLEDRKFRLQIVEGNVKIEHILSRTSTALAQSIRDISEGIRSTKQFRAYLAENENAGWRRDRPDVVRIFNAMKGNADGWYNAFEELETKSNTLSGLLVRLNTMIAEMDQRAGEVSRRTRFSIQPFSGPEDQPRSPPSSSNATSPQASPPRSKIPQSPPRISINFSSRISGFLDRPTSTAYFDIPVEDKRQTTEFRDTMMTLPPFKIADDDSPRTEAIPAVPALPVVEPIIETEAETEAVDKPAPQSPAGQDDGPLYILQPRTYTPQPPAPMPSPRIVEPPAPAEVARTPQEDTAPQPKQRTSLRQRVSLKTNPPESIHVPPRNAPELERPRYVSPRVYQAPDSAYGSDIDRDRTAVHSFVENNNDFSPPVFPKLIPSPQSDQQYFRPVQASPHSPLQQRPHTSGTFHRPGHQRNAPSAMGMSMLSSVSTLHPDDRAGSSMAGSTRTLKKKRSAFGWLKKAFSLDEEERAAFERQKREQVANPYYDGRSPKFLDGKRIR
ncbi:hypothetical protein NKR23_g11982 [Pleurostoma richardsiae]|uniref:Uncharacterized protein n=1 Tax=Pleurostoma richardsiae TaxID=41990 RepID=A0AA38VJ85_9PEZI|nr:hypothetical protein NKR23_g11982 [Pleurostoma richardsiae]